MLLPTLSSLLRLPCRAPRSGADLPRQLFEAAEARAGHDARQALELRRAACAALRVVR